LIKPRSSAAIVASNNFCPQINSSESRNPFRRHTVGFNWYLAIS
jgi:hypothetical protein